MGKTYVALFDENKQCVLLVHWGDSWVGSTQGYFNVYFYPQNGGSYLQGSGYIYSSFTKTGKLWWTSYPGGQGGIMASIDGSGDAYSIGECDNASRVIKYVGILGYRYSSYNLVDMRIHDINVVCDLNENNPIHPEPDSPSSGTIPKADPATKAMLDAYTASIPLALVTFWTGYWPLMHFVCSYALSSVLSISFEFTVDILMNFGVEGFYFGIADDPSIPMSEIEQAVQDASMKLIELSTQEQQKFWGVTLAVLWGTLGVLALGKIASPWLEALFLVLCGVWYISFVNFIAATVALIADMSPLAAVLTLAQISIPLLFGTGLTWINGGSTAWTYMNEVFDRDSLFTSLTGSQAYKDVYKMRVSLYLCLLQITALVFLAIVCFGVYIGAFR
jgi:hypothetical protein